jgi:hypothetical protein
MQTSLLKIVEREPVAATAETVLTFKPFLQYLRSRLKSERTVKSEYYRFVIDRFEREEGWREHIDLRSIDKYRELFEIAYFVLTPLAADERELFWGISTPVPGSLIFSTDRFSNFIANKNTRRKVVDNSTCSRHEVVFLYRLILDRFYGISGGTKKEVIYEYKDVDNGLLKFYKVKVDTQFVDIRVKDKLPELAFESLSSYLQDGDGNEKMICMLEELLPLSNFRVEGFTILTLKDITQFYATEAIRKAVLDHGHDKGQYALISQALQTIAGNEHLEFKLIPAFGINGKPILAEDDGCVESALIQAAASLADRKNVFNPWLNTYLDKPHAIVMNRILSGTIAPEEIHPILKAAGIDSFAWLPVYYQKEFAGIVEISSSEIVLLDEKIFSKVQNVVPLIAQLLKYNRDEFNASIENVIRDKFTPLQPAVQWKFNEVAYQYLQQNISDTKQGDISTIRFENVYPLYGAVDIRNSTHERNKAIQEDIKYQLSLLTATLNTLKGMVNSQANTALVFACARWTEQVNVYLNTKDEITFSNFLEVEINPYLRQVHSEIPSARLVIERYFAAIDETYGEAFANRRALESSLQLVNSHLGQYFDTAQKELQSAYPFYFEKFRTDGIYIGQSIAPQQEFEAQYLRNLRKWQLQSMAEVTQITYGLMPQMERPLQTTQLLFIHGNKIDISFRNDERRFDVEGAYNIRYEVIKKRIDKAIIKDTHERLTQPGKIALVYLNPLEAQEYIEYIGDLQAKGLLEDNLEFLELEELQGINRLKALRVGVNVG